MICKTRNRPGTHRVLANQGRVPCNGARKQFRRLSTRIRERQEIIWLLVSALYRTRLLMTTNSLLHPKLAENPVLRNVSLSLIPPPLDSSLRLRRRCLLRGRNLSLFRMLRRWGAGEKLTGEKIGREKGGSISRSRPSLPSFFPFVFLFALTAYDLTCPHQLNTWNRLKKPILNQQAKYVKLSLFM